jgi:hypothetical protein
MSKLCATLVGLALAFASSGVSAQVGEGGVKGGVMFADVPKSSAALRAEGAVDVGYRVGFLAGAFIAAGITDAVAIQPEVMYAQKGLKGKDPNGSVPFEFKLDYIDIPVLVRVGGTGPSGFKVLAGPSFNFNIRARAVQEDQFNPDEDIKDNVEAFEVGLVLGAGFYGTRLIVEGRFQEGLTNVLKGVEDETHRNRSFAALVGIRFR